MKRRAPRIISALLLSACGATAAARADSTVVFNELLYHPATNEAGLEWVELHSQMAVDVDLSGWSLGKGVFYRIPDGTVIPGGGFLVIAIDPDTLAAATGFAGALGPYTGRLDNSGERLELLDNSGRVMDSMRYRDDGDWPVAPDGSGVSLAKIDPASASAPAENWAPSARIGGTPGEPNFPDGAAGVPALPPGLVSFWNFDGSGGTAPDGAGTNPGTLGSAARRVGGIVGQGALALDNTLGAYVNVGAGDGFSVTTGITIEALIAAAWSGAAGDQDMIFRKEDGLQRVVLGFQHDGNADGFSEPPLAPVYTGPVLSFGLNVAGIYRELDMPLDGLDGRPTLEDLRDGRPHHVAATHDSASGLKSISIDGRRVYSLSLQPGGLVSSGGATLAYIGNMSGRRQPFTGTIDEVAFWSRALTEGEIAAHVAAFRAGRGYLAPPPGASSSAPLAFNEYEATVARLDWIEIVNHGDRVVELEGHAIAPGNLGGEFVFAPRLLGPGEFITLSGADLGLAAGIGGKLFLFAPGRVGVIDAVSISDAHRGRHPDGAGPWLFPSAPTPGEANTFRFHDEIVINEILYHPGPAAGEPPTPVESPETWVELHNRGSRRVDLTGWELDEGIDYAFEPGTAIGPGEYLVVAKDRDFLRARYPGIPMVGNFSGRLSRRSDRIVLRDDRGNPADQVRYFDDGRWPALADGGGSSLELRDPRADNSRGEAWAASDERSKTDWKTYRHRGPALPNVGPTQWREFVLGLLDAGEVLLDDLRVVESPSGASRDLLQNGDFEAGADHWRLLGTHRHSRVIPDPENPGNRVLHLVATGATEHMHNHLETTLANNASIVHRRVYEISFRARWLAGSNQLNTRLYFNRVPRTTRLDVPDRIGTPGLENSTFRENIGPTYADFRHTPAVPDPGEAVTVSVAAADPDGVDGVDLWWALTAGAWQSAAMAPAGDGRFTGAIPGQGSSRVVQFYVEGRDRRGAVSTFPARGRDSRALFKVQDGQARPGPLHGFRIIMTAADAGLLHRETNVMSNERLGATIIRDEKEVFYDVGVRLKGSQRGRPGGSRVSFSARFQPDRLFRGVHRTVALDRSGGWGIGAGPTGQDEIIVKHTINRGGLPGMYDDLAWLVAPRSAQNGPALLMMAKYTEVFLDSRYENGTDGSLYKMELIYYPTTTVNGRPDGLKRPLPDLVIGTDLRDLGDDREAYRWNFLLENNTGRDDYSGLMELARVMGLPASAMAARIEDHLDVDEATRMYAVHTLCGISDTYWFAANFHNVMFYQVPADGRFQILAWDNDVAFTRSTAAPLWGGPNLAKLYRFPAYQRLFYAHIRDILETTYNLDYMTRWTSHYGRLAGETGSFGTVRNYIGARSRFVLNSLPGRVPLAITTNNGNDFTVDTLSVTIEGSAWIDARTILVAEREEAPVVGWPAINRWRASVRLLSGANRLTFLAFDVDGGVVGSDSITVTTTAGFPRPVVTGVEPGEAAPGESVTIRGDSFHAGIEVLFGDTSADGVTFDESVDPRSLAATVPDLAPGRVDLGVRNIDGKISAPVGFLVLPLAGRFIRGDASGNGIVDLSDAVRILLHLFGQDAALLCEDAADVNDDEAIQVTDAIFLLNYLFLGGPAPREPHPRPGTDATGDGALGCGP